MAIIGALGVYYANTNRGVPVVVVIVSVFLIFWTFVASRTQFGRHVYAVGGSPRPPGRGGHQRRQDPHRRLHDRELHGLRRRNHPRLAAPVQLIPARAAGSCC